MRLLIVVLCLVVQPYLFIYCRKLTFGDKNQFVVDSHQVLGKGGFGKVYRAIDTYTNREVAVKTETTRSTTNSVQTECTMYEIIGRQHGIPKIFYCGITKDGKSYVIVLQLLGKSLADLQNRRKGAKFTPKTVFMIGIQLMDRIELIHAKRLVHGDIKPGNMAIGKSRQIIYIFDFGLSTKFVDSEGRHVLEGNFHLQGSGTPRYMSAYAHSHKIQSRRDDLEAIGFMLMSFLRGDLPWDRALDHGQTNKMIQMKQSLQNLFQNPVAKQMIEYFDYIRNQLEFSTRPDYEYLRDLFRSALADMNETEDFRFDWRRNLPMRRTSTRTHMRRTV